MDLKGLRELRRALAERGPGRGGRLPEVVRTRAMAHAQRQRRRGASVRRIADELGVSYETVRRWTADTERAAAVPVAIVADPRPAGRTVSVVSPAGYRVEGLSLDEAAALLRALT